MSPGRHSVIMIHHGSPTQIVHEFESRRGCEPGTDVARSLPAEFADETFVQKMAHNVGVNVALSIRLHPDKRAPLWRANPLMQVGRVIGGAEFFDVERNHPRRM